MAGKWHFKCQLKPLKNIFYHEIIELRCCREWSGYARGNTAIFLVRPVFVQPPWFGFLQTKHLYLLLPTFLFLSVCLGRHFSPRASDLQDISLSAHGPTQPQFTELSVENSMLKTFQAISESLIITRSNATKLKLANPLNKDKECGSISLRCRAGKDKGMRRKH